MVVKITGNDINVVAANLRDRSALEMFKRERNFLSYPSRAPNPNNTWDMFYRVVAAFEEAGITSRLPEALGYPLDPRSHQSTSDQMKKALTKDIASRTAKYHFDFLEGTEGRFPDFAFGHLNTALNILKRSHVPFAPALGLGDISDEELMERAKEGYRKRYVKLAKEAFNEKEINVTKIAGYLKEAEAPLHILQDDKSPEEIVQKLHDAARNNGRARRAVDMLCKASLPVSANDKTVPKNSPWVQKMKDREQAEPDTRAL